MKPFDSGNLISSFNFFVVLVALLTSPFNSTNPAIRKSVISRLRQEATCSFHHR